MSLSDLAIENAEALADDVNPLCPDGCVDPKTKTCLCNGKLYKLTPFDWGEEEPPVE